MIPVMIISSLTAVISIAIQLWSFFKEKVIRRRLYASVVLIAPCLLGFYGNRWTSYATINADDTRITLILSVIFSILVILINRKAGKQHENIQAHPQIRTPRWTLSLFAMNGLSWIIYLICYECLFRGYIFFSFLQYTSVENAFILAIVLYALAHLNKGEKEFLLSIPFGFIICYITLVTENVWAAIIIHCVLAISNDVFAFRANPLFSISFPSTKNYRYEK